jgi:hypothetical protein
VKKRDDLHDVIQEESSRGKKRPVDTDAIRAQEEKRRAAVLHILRRGTREDLRALLKAWGYSKGKSKRRLGSTTLYVSGNLLGFRIGLGPFFGSHFGGSFVDLSCDTFRQLLELVFLRTFELGYGHGDPFFWRRFYHFHCRLQI